MTTENKYTKEDLKAMQSMSLERKIQASQTRIMEWYMKHDGKVYVSFSGGGGFYCSSRSGSPYVS